MTFAGKTKTKAMTQTSTVNERYISLKYNLLLAMSGKGVWCLFKASMEKTDVKNENSDRESREREISKYALMHVRWGSRGGGGG